MQVLVVVKDVILANGITRILAAQGINATAVHTGYQADTVLQRREPSVMLLDVDVSDHDSAKVLRRLRSRGSTMPVLILSAQGAVQSQAQARQMGADDFMPKPFAAPNLVDRVRTLLRRGAPPVSVLQAGGLTLDLLAHSAKVDGKVLDLSAREWEVLKYLVSQAGRVASRQQIIEAVLPWGGELSPNAVEVYVSRIRHRIGNSSVVIRAIRGQGYALEVQPDWHESVVR